jgi:hypothetical protein
MTLNRVQTPSKPTPRNGASRSDDRRVDIIAPARDPESHATAVPACAKAFSVFVLCTVSAGIAFGSMMYAFAVRHFGVQVVSGAAMVGVGTIACRAVRPLHAALDIIERRTVR